VYLLAKCQHNANNNATDNAKWSTEQKNLSHRITDCLYKANSALYFLITSII